MARMTPAEAAAKYATRMKNALPEIRAGIQRVTESPTAKAASKREKWVARLQDPEVQDKWQRNLQAVDLASWQTAALNKGVNRIAAGVDGSVGKMEAFFTKLFPFQESLQKQIAGMPDLTLQDSINRAAAWITGMSKFKK